MTFECSPSGKQNEPALEHGLNQLQRGLRGGSAIRQANFQTRQQAQAARRTARLEGRGSRVERAASKSLPSSALRRTSLRALISLICASAMAQPTGWPRNVLVWIASPLDGGHAASISVGASDAGREREAARQRFAQANHVRHRPGVFAGKPFPGAPEAGVNLIQNQQGVVLVTKPAQQRQKPRRRNVDAAAHLNRLDQHRANPFAPEKAPHVGFDWLQSRRGVSPGLCCSGALKPGQARRLAYFGKRHKVAELAKLAAERRPEMRAVGGIERAIAKAVISAFKGNHARLARRQQRRLERRLHRLEARVAEDRLAPGTAAVCRD